jgi:hypothetical protein
MNIGSKKNQKTYVKRNLWTGNLAELARENGIGYGTLEYWLRTGRVSLPDPHTKPRPLEINRP